ncbi:MAG: response regulator [Nitrospirae bacterium]|nr:response regulator [Nitrospirota bacterium]MBF0616928.1 response regulator [Nitrospirota bacterium]
MLIDDAATNGTNPLHIEEFKTVQELGIQLLETVNELFPGHNYDTALVDIKKVDLLFIIPIQIYILCETQARLSGIDCQTKDIKTIQSAIGRFLSLASDAKMTQSFKGSSIGESTLSLVETYLSRINTSALSNNVVQQEGVGKSRILVVDDNRLNREIIQRRLSKLSLGSDSAVDGEEALIRLTKDKYDLILLDINMPGINGYEVLSRLKSNPALCDIPVIMLSAMTDTENVVKAIEMGAEDFIPKPFEYVILKARIMSLLVRKSLQDQKEAYKKQLEQINLNLEDRVRTQVKELSSSHLAMIFALSKLAESRDQETGEHLERVKSYCDMIARTLSVYAQYDKIIDADFIETLAEASQLHDIGKVGIPDSILLKPGKLTAEEFGIMKTHTTIGAQTLRNVELKHGGNQLVRMGIEVTENHHERYDGKGYPNALAGEQIPLSARILALCDVYDALRSKRCYKLPMTHLETAGIIIAERGQQFSPEVIDAFIECHEELDKIWVQLHG